jgi:mono/diheme cytochrome c family protein
MKQILVVLTLVAAACGDNNPKGNADAGTPDGGQSAVDRGRYLMNNVGLCTFCHTPLLENGMRDETRLLAGVACFFDIDEDPDSGVGCLSSRNLTNHATGLANVTDQQIKDAFTKGIRTDGKTLSPVMPYWIYHNMTDEDADAIVAYLRTVPGVDNAIPPNESPWVEINESDPRQLLPLVTEADIPLPRGGANNQSAMRGRYLSSMAGLCIDCHTPETDPVTIFPLDFSRPYGGGRIFPREGLGLIDPSYPALIMTRNLTPHATGLEGWTRAQIRDAIVNGKDRDGNAVCAATHGGLTSPYAALDPQDLDDIVEYIHELPPVDHDTVDCQGPGCGNCAGPPVP